MSRPLQPRKDAKSREERQRRLARARDGSVCRLEKKVDRSPWIECGKRGSQDTCHIYKRADCGEAWDAVEVVITGCRECHDTYDHRIVKPTYQVRVPRHREVAAWRFLERSHKINGIPKVMPVRKAA